MKITKILSIPSIGKFKTIELIEIIGIPSRKNKKVPFNIFTIAIAQDLDLPIVKDQTLTEKPIQLKKEKSLKFGIFKSILSIEEFIEKLMLLDDSKWQNSKGNSLACGKLKAIPNVFVPVHYDDKNDFLGLLKNNFFNGSHVFEWFDESKTEVQVLLDNHQALIELSEELQKIIPIEMASHSDRLGNFLVQIPCSTIDIDIQKKEKDSNNIKFNLAINPNIEIDLNDFTAIFWRDEQNNLMDFYKGMVSEGENTIPFEQINGKCNYTIWDNKHNIICAGGKTSYFAESFALSINIREHTPRILKLPNGVEKRIKVSSKVSHNNNHQKDYREWISKRIIKQERSSLKQNLKLRQFKKDERKEAIEMLHTLIKRHGSDGVYLWDPFLSADDLLETLCLCPYAKVPLKALTGMKSIHSNNNVDDYKFSLDISIVESAGLSLTFLKADNSQGSFHDRFLIFPKTQYSNARAWSLGTSVNSLGKSHHIIQEVEDGQIIEDVFEEMWHNSFKEENIIWQSSK